MNFDDLIPAIQGRNWYAVAALAIWAIVAFAKNRAPELYYRIPDGWRWLPPVLLAAATGFVDGFASGLPWQQASMRALFAVVTMGVGAMGVHGALAASPLKYGGGASGILLAIGLSLAVPTACAGKPAESAATERTAALAYTGAVVALEVLDAREAAYLDSLAQPTPEQLKAAEARVERLHRARDALSLVRDWLSGRRDQPAKGELGQAAQALRLVVEELRADGVRIPAAVLDGIQLAELFAGVAS